MKRKSEVEICPSLVHCNNEEKHVHKMLNSFDGAKLKEDKDFQEKLKGLEFIISIIEAN